MPVAASRKATSVSRLPSEDSPARMRMAVVLVLSKDERKRRVCVNWKRRKNSVLPGVRHLRGCMWRHKGCPLREAGRREAGGQ